LIHSSPYVGQLYHKSLVYRNPAWVFGYSSTNSEEIPPFLLKQSGSAIYQIVIPKQYLNTCVEFRDSERPSLVLTPWQVLKFIEEKSLEYPLKLSVDEAPSVPLRVFKILKFEVVDDYKNYVKWQRKTVLKNVKQ
jgi:hypothetical protein